MPRFESIVEQLQSRDPLPPLMPKGAWKPELSREILAVSDSELVASTQSTTAADACRAGLLLWNDDLDASHTISQSLEDATGSFWHAIMHRREGDYFNSNYWWRRTGAHPAFADVYEAVLSALQQEHAAEAQSFMAQLRSSGTWQPTAFVALCETARANDEWLRRAQVAEMQALLNWCRANA